MKILHTLALLFICLLALVIPVDALMTPGGVPLVKFTGLMSFACVVLLVFNGMALRGSGWFILICLIHVSWFMASFLWTSMPVDYQHAHAINSQQSIKVHFYLIAVVLLMFQVVRSQQDLQWMFVSFLLGCIWLIGLLLSSYEPGVRTVRHELKGLDANEMAVIICIGVSLAVYLVVLGRSVIWRLLGVIYLPLAMTAVLITGSRTGLVVMLVGMSGLIVLFLKANMMMRLASIAVVAATLVWVVDAIPDKTLERLMSTGSELSSGTVSERSIIWKKAWYEFGEKPLTGQGLGSFRHSMNKHNVEYTAHNSYISIAIEQGIIGLLFYLAVIMTVFWQALSLNNVQRWLLLPTLLVVVLGQMTLTLHEAMYSWFVYMAVMLAVLLNNEAQPRQEVV